MGKPLPSRRPYDLGSRIRNGYGRDDIRDSRHAPGGYRGRYGDYDRSGWERGYERIGPGGRREMVIVLDEGDRRGPGRFASGPMPPRSPPRGGRYDRFGGNFGGRYDSRGPPRMMSDRPIGDRYYEADKPFGVDTRGYRDGGERLRYPPRDRSPPGERYR